MTELVKVILGSLLLKPGLLESADLRDSDFPPGRFRETFAAIAELWEMQRPSEIDPVLLAGKIGGNGAASYVSGLLDGTCRLDPALLRSRVTELRRRAITARIRQKLWAQEKFLELDLAEILPDIEELQNLDPEAADQTPLSLSLSAVEPKGVPWLWPDFIPLGRATLISGDPGSAKTWFCLDLAARLSRGFEWPDGSLGPGPAKTYYLSVEDDPHDTIRPRIDSLGGDPSMIACYNSEHPLHLDLSKADGIKRLETEISRIGDVRLVVVDPIIDFSGGVNPNAGEEVRALLTPLIRIAAKLNFALVLVGHLNKAQTLSAIYRSGGSTSGWLGKCRAAFMIFRDLDDRGLRHVIPIKTNLARHDPRQLEFRINDGKLAIGPSSEEVDPDEQLGSPQRGPNPRERDEAAKWLNAYFAGQDEIPALEVEEAARANMISESTLKRAKKAAGFISRRRNESGGRGIWVWARGPRCL